MRQLLLDVVVWACALDDASLLSPLFSGAVRTFACATGVAVLAASLTGVADLAASLGSVADLAASLTGGADLAASLVGSSACAACGAVSSKLGKNTRGSTLPDEGVLFCELLLDRHSDNQNLPL